MEAKTRSWNRVFDELDLWEHDFKSKPYKVRAREINEICHDYHRAIEREARLLCKQDTRESRPQVFKDKELFVISTKHGEYTILHGEGYFDLLEPKKRKHFKVGKSWDSVTEKFGDSETTYLTHSYNIGLFESIAKEKLPMIGWRGNHRLSEFKMNIGNYRIPVKGVQFEVDGMYEGENTIMLVEAKNRKVTNSRIQQLYYPYIQLKHEMKKKGIKKKIQILFFQKHENNVYDIWKLKFKRVKDYNSIILEDSNRYIIN